MRLQLFNPGEVAARSEEMDFRELGTFDAGMAGVFRTPESGTSPWEMHPDCDELLYVIEGEIDVDVLPPDGGPQSVANLKAGWFLIVPKGCWHRQHILTPSQEFFLTPGKTLHSEQEDPRNNKQ
jgi:mannose-6-phosphate isomerase-like protein (cupin superfamily)